MAAAHRAAGEPGRGNQECLGPAIARGGALRVVDPVHRQGSVLGDRGALQQCHGVGLGGVVQVERHVLGRRGGLGEAAIRVFGHHLGHRDRALGQRREAGRVERAGRNHGRPLADEHA